MKASEQKIATVGLILLKDDHILLLQRYNTGWADGYYAFVAGCVDENESITQALCREAYEEARIIIHPEWLKFGCVLDTVIQGRKKYRYIDFFFLCRQWEGEIYNSEPHKHQNLGFYPLSHLPSPLLPLAQEGLTRSLQGTSLYAEVGWATPLHIK